MNQRKKGKFQAEIKHVQKGWKKIFGSIQDGIFYLYMKEKEFKCGQPTLAIDLAHCICKDSTSKETGQSLTIANEHHVFTIKLDKEEEKTEWLNALDYEISLCKKREARFRSQAVGVEERDLLLRELHKTPEK